MERKPHADVELKIADLKNRLQSLGHFPSKTENSALYSIAKYYYSNYPEHPVIAYLMERFPYTSKKKPSVFQGMTFDEKIDWLESKLKEYQRIPSIHTPGEKNVASNIIRFYSNYPDNERVKKLIYLYPTHEVFSKLISEHRGLDNYILKCVELYGELPGERSIPMCELSSKCKLYN